MIIKNIAAVDTEAKQNLLSKQINLFAFDLKNEAAEHGFKANESWALHFATAGDVSNLKKIHFPVVSVKLQPELLLAVYYGVKSQLQQPLNTTDENLTTADLNNGDKNYLVAYPVRSIRK